MCDEDERAAMIVATDSIALSIQHTAAEPALAEEDSAALQSTSAIGNRAADGWWKDSLESREKLGVLFQMIGANQTETVLISVSMF